MLDEYKNLNPIIMKIRNLDTMKKQISYLFAVFFLLTMCSAKADPVAGSLNLNTLHGYEAGAFNKMEQDQINSYQIDKSYVQSLDEVTKDDRIYDATVEEDVAREGVL